MTATIINPFDPETWGEDEKVYFSQIDSAFGSKGPLLIGNGEPAHAAYLIEKFMTNAEREVCLFSGCLKQDAQGVAVYGDSHIHEAMCNLFDRGGKLKVVLEDDVDADGKDVDNHPMVACAKQWADDKDGVGPKPFFDIRKATSSSIQRLKEDDIYHHWMVMDRRVFRLETSMESYKAAVGFGRSGFADALATIFDDLYESATPLI